MSITLHLKFFISIFVFFVCFHLSSSQYPIWGGVVSIDLDTQSIQYRTAAKDTILVELDLKVIIDRLTIERTIDTNGQVIFNKLKGGEFVDRINQETDTENWNQYFTSIDLLTTVIEGSSQMLELENPTSFIPFHYEVTTRYNRKGVPRYFVKLRFKQIDSDGLDEFGNYQVIFNDKFRPTLGQLLSNLN
ncbi:MAG: hypothetical protein OXE77_01055 [Flavobacteriaceae bacterium]|nr:hypothetical protein [Flavobacteriaceae bacterium]MCY4266748.1 hypothetical protein [Flavobacteriaceae bacterium]MCY4297762.1 hypothetical protein [Flavobacteriaceae bacterium]